MHRAARQEYWDLCDEAIDSGDYKLHSTLPDWRRRALASHAAVFNAVKDEDRPIRQAARLVRSIEPDRPSRNSNPAAVAAHLQPAISSGDLSEQQAQYLVDLAANGVNVEEFRDLNGKALDLSVGNVEEEEDEDVLLEFYWHQAAMGRCLMLDESLKHELDQLGELVISPSFLVRATGKKPRAILHLSSTE